MKCCTHLLNEVAQNAAINLISEVSKLVANCPEINFNVVLSAVAKLIKVTDKQ